ncbi:MAG: glycosyltransferase family 4 protein [Ignavibacteria bacterium]|nr:glycosyltransferase family 4 protein [Ignavibacteria bacterium]
MQKLNWIILKNKDRGIDYGVGTFIKQLSQGLAQMKHIKVFVLEIGLTYSKSFAIRDENGMTILEIPVGENSSGIDTKKNQEKLSSNISRVVSQYIPKAEITVIHMNFIFQYFIARELKTILNGRVIFTQHVFTMDEITMDNFFDTEIHTYELVDKIITVTNHGKKHLIAKGIKEDKIEVIYIGIVPKHLNNQFVDVKRKYGLNGNEKLVLYSGRIDPIKGLDYLCNAFELLLKKASDCRLVIAGDGNFESLKKDKEILSKH